MRNRQKQIITHKPLGRPDKHCLILGILNTKLVGAQPGGQGNERREDKTTSSELKEKNGLIQLFHLIIKRNDIVK